MATSQPKFETINNNAKLKRWTLKDVDIETDSGHKHVDTLLFLLKTVKCGGCILGPPRHIPLSGACGD